MAEVSTISNTSTPSSTAEPAHSSFEWRRSEHIESLNVTMEEYVHRKTGAVHYHLHSDNAENVFLVAFRTMPMDSRGVAHILEHTALCGSQRYPVRDPFFMMIRRSLNTFMNAFTSSDWTAYPFASKNKKDFNNLLDVYLDAAFFSRLHPLDFAQEGHRLEFSDSSDTNSELVYKGVVFNEMKGAMSSINSVLWQTMSKYLFPTTTYHFNSGGEPDEIPDLSYDQLIAFYKTHYHPSNAIFMTFGDIPAIEHQQQFDELALSKFDKLDVNIAVDDEKRYLAPIRIEEFYAVDEIKPRRTHIVVGWLLGRSTNLQELFEAQLLTGVLMDNSASPLLRALETTELGASPSPMCGLEDSNREMTFMAGLEGCDSETTEQVEKLVLDTLAALAETGVPQDQVDAALHQLELSQREISGDSFPYGLQLILTGLSTALHRGDPIKLLDIEPVLEDLRSKVKDPQYIPSLIRRLLLDNTHRITLTMRPDSEISRRKVEAEKQRLAAIQATLSDEQKTEIAATTEALQQRQAQIDDPGLLPKVGLEDVPAQLEEPKREALKLQSSEAASFYAQGTNGLSYQQIVMRLPELDSELLDILPLYTSCLPEFGIGDKDYSEVQTWQAQVSGGVNCFSSIRSAVDDVQNTSALISFSSKSLTRNHSALTQLLQATISDVRFDEGQRLQELVEQICARKESSITGQGHSLAMNLASSQMSPTAQLTHRFGGLQGIKWLKDIRDGVADEDERSALLEKFKRLHELVNSTERQFLLIGEASHRNDMLADLNECWPQASSSSIEQPLQLPSIRNQVRQAWTTATQVSFCAKAYPTVASSHADNAVLHVLAGFMRNGFLHRAIREQGGAYGGGAGQDANSASFRFFSYRDPRLQETLDDFDRAIDWVMNDEHSPHQLEEAILGVIAAMDKSTSPAGEAKQAFYNHLSGRTLEQRMAFRARVLETDMADLRRVAEAYFAPDKASIGVITNKDLLDGLTDSGIEIINL